MKALFTSGTTLDQCPLNELALPETEHVIVEDIKQLWISFDSQQLAIGVEQTWSLHDTCVCLMMLTSFAYSNHLPIIDKLLIGR